jgi:tetratricopeptide (TPR) repeat protein
LRDLNLAIGRGADHLPSRVTRALLLLEVKRFRESSADLDVALRHEKNGDATLFYFRGQARAGLGQWQEAWEDFRKAASLAPHSARNVRATVLLSERLTPDVGLRRQLLRELLLQQPRTIENDDRLLAEVIWPAILFPDNGTALADWLPYMQKVTAQHLSPLERNRVLGAALLRTGQPREAIGHLLNATKADPDGGTAWDWFFLALTHHTLKDPSAAQAALTSAKSWMLRRKDGQLRNPRYLAELTWIEEMEVSILQAEVVRVLQAQR